MTHKETVSDPLFPAGTQEDWVTLAEATLKGRQIADLARPHEDGFSIEAFYASQHHHKVLSDDVAASAARHWVMAQYLDLAEDPKTLNAMIMDELKGGVERIIFPSGQPLDIISNAMDGVMADAIVLSFDRPDNMALAFDQVTSIWADQKTDPDLARGSLGVPVSPSTWEDIRALMTDQKAVLDGLPQLKIMTISGAELHRRGATTAQELGLILASFVDVMRRSEEAGFNLEDSSARLEIDLAIDADLYGNIAKVRALRMMLTRLCTLCGLDGGDLSSRLHGITSDRMLSRMDPETNMLRSGTAMLSMALSGLGVLTIRPHDWLTGSSPLSRRIARNVHHLLADESQLNQIADPAQGSYFIDNLTYEISDKAWQIFQEIEREGGLAQAEDKGLTNAWFDAANAYRQDRVNRGKDAVLGVTIHPVSGADHCPDIIIDGRDGDMRAGALVKRWALVVWEYSN